MTWPLAADCLFWALMGFGAVVIIWALMSANKDWNREE